MRILSFNAAISSSISRMTEKAVEMLSPEEKKIGIIASAIFVTCLVAFCLYRLICFKGRRLEKAAEKQSLGQTAEKLRKDCKFEEAAKIFQEALKQNPADIFSIQKYTKTLHALEKTEEAVQQNTKVIEHYKKVVEAHPKDSQALREYARALLMGFQIKDDSKNLQEINKKLKEPLLQINKAIEIDPQDVVAQRLYAKILLTHACLGSLTSHGTINEGKLKKTIKKYLPLTKKTSEAAPKDSGALKDFGIALHLNKQIEGARLVYEKMLQLNPRDVHALRLLGELCLEQKDYKGAEKHFSQCLAIRPRYITVLKKYATTLRELNKSEEEAKQYEKILEIYPDNVNYLSQYGDILRTLKKPAAAMEQYDKALKLDPKNESILEKKDESFKEVKSFLKK